MTRLNLMNIVYDFWYFFLCLCHAFNHILLICCKSLDPSSKLCIIFNFIHLFRGTKYMNKLRFIFLFFGRKFLQTAYVFDASCKNFIINFLWSFLVLLLNIKDLSDDSNISCRLINKNIIHLVADNCNEKVQRCYIDNYGKT